MASGIKGQEKPSGGTPTFATSELFKATTTTTVILSCSNITATADPIFVALIDGATATSNSGGMPTGAITDKHWIENGYSLAANSTLERTGIVMETDACLIVGSTNGAVSFSVYGLES